MAKYRVVAKLGTKSGVATEYTGCDSIDDVRSVLRVERLKQNLISVLVQTYTGFGHWTRIEAMEE